MKDTKEAIARIGMVDFIITAPIYEPWKRSVFQKRCKIVKGSPTALSKKLSDGDLDMGFVSILDYGYQPDRYSILSGLSMSATGSDEGPGSAFLFSHVPPDQLDQVEVLLCSKSKTAVELVKIILEEFFSVVPRYTSGDSSGVDAGKFTAVLAIGDDALRIAAGSTYLYQLDLANIWRRETGLPFVFAVCTVRQDFCLEQKELLAEIHKELLHCRDEGTGDIKEICNVSASRIPMSVASCCSYLNTIEYDLDDQKQKALVTFFDFLIKRGEIEESSLPLKICSNLM
ncbi:MAG: menaquinone biosynthesis protein [Deltaproteobacteria bacterium]|nr:menaquinone biosynthesis protein [Deltaproteobacteria bacterium]